MAKIRLFLGGEFQGQYPLKEGYEIKVGRSTLCDIIIQNADVSRHHCSFKFQQGLWFVVDADSANGTYLNGELVGERVLRHTDRVGIGQHTLLFDQYGLVSAQPQVGLYPEAEEAGRPGTVLMYREELEVLLEGAGKQKAMGLVLAARQRIVVPLVKSSTTIGSDWESDLRITGWLVKPLQALVLQNTEGHVVIDQGGPRSLYLNGRKLKPKEVPLKSGDVLEIAGHQIFYGSL